MDVMRQVVLGLVVAALSAVGAPAAADEDAVGSARQAMTAFLPVDRDVPSGVPVVTYEIRSTRAAPDDVEVFAAVAAHTLNDPRGWGGGGRLTFAEVERDGDFRLWLATPAQVAAADWSCSAAYSCRVGDDVYINAQRWRAGTRTFASRTLAQYRQYVINHEVGHWLGLGHRGCRGAGQPAAVMQQQSISLDGCEPRVWPLPIELRRATPPTAPAGG